MLLRTEGAERARDRARREQEVGTSSEKAFWAEVADEIEQLLVATGEN